LRERHREPQQQNRTKIDQLDVFLEENFVEDPKPSVSQMNQWAAQLSFDNKTIMVSEFTKLTYGYGPGID